ncbi:hypothetical protein [Nissabacter sp. SGAir0207]
MRRRPNETCLSCHAHLKTL